MTGRGVDQILARPGDPELHEPHVSDARTYVRLAESANGPVPSPVGPGWPWGDLLESLDRWSPDVRIANVETSVTTSDEFAPGKVVHYRMHPHNVGCLAPVRLDVAALANNHVLDFGVAGLRETLETMTETGLPTAGAGTDAQNAWRAVRTVTASGRVLVWSVASQTSGVPRDWAATEHAAGVALLPDLSRRAADEVGQRLAAEKEPGDVAVVSVHWGSNWGYEVPRSHARFAHRLVDAGVDVVHGHSSHHPRPIEVYRGRLVLYGCGDLVNDYEGIAGNGFRDDLRLGYLASLRPDGALHGLGMIPLQARRMRLGHAARDDAAWLARTLTRTSRGFGTRTELDDTDGTLVLRWS